MPPQQKVKKMESFLNVGSKVDKESSVNAADAVVSVIKAGFEARLSDDVMTTALHSLTAMIEVKNVTITGCTFDNDQSKKVEVIVPDSFTEK